MREITPKKLRCGVGLCPAIFELDDGKIVIIGKLPISDSEIPEVILSKVGDGEGIVILPPEYLKDIKL